MGVCVYVLISISISPDRFPMFVLILNGVTHPGYHIWLGRCFYVMLVFRFPLPQYRLGQYGDDVGGGGGGGGSSDGGCTDAFVILAATGNKQLAYSQNNVCWLRGYLIILKLLAGIEMVARPVTFEMVANDAAVTFGATLFDMTFGPIELPTTETFDSN